MLKRYQVLLDDWLADFIKERAERFDISFSETIRMVLCIYYTMLISQQCKGCKCDMTIKKNVAMTNKWMKSSEFSEEMHRAMSKVYFEARKAIESYNTQNKK